METENKNMPIAETATSNENDAISQEALKIYYDELYAIERERYNSLFGQLVPDPILTRKVEEAKKEVVIPEYYYDNPTTLRTLSPEFSLSKENMHIIDARQQKPIAPVQVAPAPVSAPENKSCKACDEQAAKKIKKLKKQRGFAIFLFCLLAVAIAGHFVYQLFI